MKSLAIAGIALPILLGCCNSVDNNNAINNLQVAELERASSKLPERRLCRRITTSSSGGDASLVGSLTASIEGRSFISPYIKDIKNWHTSPFAATEMIGSHCWAVAQMGVVKNGSREVLYWKCPVASVSDAADGQGYFTLESISEEECAFQSKKGDVTRVTPKAHVQVLNV